MSSEGSGGKGHVVGAWAMQLIVRMAEGNEMDLFSFVRRRDAVNDITHQLVVFNV